MSYSGNVEGVAAWLDNHNLVPSDWRDKVDTSILEMISTTRCVIGQIFGEYDEIDKLDPAYTNWIRSTLAGYTDEWKEYLDRAIRPGRFWRVRLTGVKHEVHATFTANGKKYVAISNCTTGVVHSLEEGDFRERWTPIEEEKYEYGDVLHSESRKVTIVYLSDTVCLRTNTSPRDGVVRFGFGTLDWYRENYPDLKKTGDSVGGAMRKVKSV